MGETVDDTQKTETDAQKLSGPSWNSECTWNHSGAPVIDAAALLGIKPKAVSILHKHATN